MSLVSLGWSEMFASHISESDNVARITSVHKSHLVAITETGEINIHHSGGFSDPLGVGDWITTTPLFIDEQGKNAALVKDLIPRKSKISRMSADDNAKEQIIAANVDTAFVVTSINEDFNLNRLERYLFLIKKGLARPVIILSKADLKESFEQIAKDLSEQLDEDVLIIPTSVLSKKGSDQVRALMPEGSTSVFIGSSGVGKSSLVNLILNQDIQAVKEIREGDGKGKHTTTSRQMFFIPSGGMIIDTPGIRGVSVFGAEEYLSEAFAEVEELITQCKYSDCQHSTEPSCAINNALETGELTQKKWDNYQKLLKEVMFNNKKLSKEASSNTKKRWKKIQTNYKARKKFKGKN